MVRIQLYVVAAIAFLSAQTPAGAFDAPTTTYTQPYRTAIAGKPFKLDHYMNVNPDCTPYPGRTEVRIISAPEHGQLSTKNGYDYPNFPTSNPRYVCNTKRIRAIELWYQAPRSYSGPDAATVEVIHPTGVTRQTRYSFMVEQ